jgi:hypothetical protein
MTTNVDTTAARVVGEILAAVDSTMNGSTVRS